MVETSVQNVFFNGVAGFITGYAMGYAVKKAIAIIWKIGLFIMGSFFMALLWLNTQGIVSLNFGKIEEKVNEEVGKYAPNVLNSSGDNTISNINTVVADQLNNVLVTLGVPLTSGLALGFFMGVRKA